MVREIEFEFREDDSGGKFMACGNVLSTLRDTINRGDIDAAARLYASCTEGVGDEILADVRAGASSRALQATAAMFEQARDFMRAAQCAEWATRLEDAARLYEAAYDFDKAAALWLQSGKVVQAAALFEKTKNFAKAGELYFKANELVRAASCFEQARSYLNAGKLYIKTGRYERAVEVLQRLEAQAPGYADARQLLARLSAHRAAYAQPVAASTPVMAPAPAPLDLGAQKRVPSEQIIAIDPEFEFLKRLPLFAELSLDELRTIHTQTERVRFKAGEPLIRQGTPGVALFIVTRGKVKVATRDAKGQELVLVELGAGAYVGEMSLIDAALTSADVVAVDDVGAFRLSQEHFRKLLLTNERIALRFYRTFVGDLVRRLRDTNRKLQQKPA